MDVDTSLGPSRFPQNPPTQSFTNHSTVPRTETEDGLLGVGSRWSEDAAGGDRIRAGAGNRMSRLVGMKAGLSPPPPPGPPRALKISTVGYDGEMLMEHSICSAAFASSRW